MATVEELKEMFVAVLGDDIDVSTFSEKSDLRKDIGMNSISFLYMAMTLEEKYSIRFDNSDFEKIKTVQDAIDVVESKVREK
ncbi:MAG: hypothetical protein IJB70_10415 [Clostridia bacterium]|nr:hypothetical protein [Clostridia bacterium]